MAKKRGPTYPGISLPDAIERVRRIVQEEPHNEMTSAAAAQHLGYKGLSGASLTALANLRRYGLIEGRGDQVKVSRDALTIITDEHSEDQKERAEALIRCAKIDSVFSGISTSFKGIPAKATLVSYLVKSGFNNDSAEEAAENYIESMKFVKEQTKEYNSGDERSGTPKDVNRERYKPPGMKDIQLPLSTDTWATLSAPFPLDETAWSQMIGILNAMKPALVADKAALKQEEQEADENK